jgi:hypothetical protein
MTEQTVFTVLDVAVAPLDGRGYRCSWMNLGPAPDHARAQSFFDFESRYNRRRLHIVEMPLAQWQAMLESGYLTGYCDHPEQPETATHWRWPNPLDNIPTRIKLEGRIGGWQ